VKQKSVLFEPQMPFALGSAKGDPLPAVGLAPWGDLSVIFGRRRLMSIQGGMSRMPISRSTDFSFLPKDLLEKCTPFIIRYHELKGYACLADILWHPEVRNFIEIEASFQRLFRKSTSSRSAKRANEGLVSIASIILAVEILSIGFAGWGNRYPAARKKAQALLEEYVPGSRPCLIERYLYPQMKRGQQSLGAFAPLDANARFEATQDAS
jgi:hypothetical protein